MRALRLHGPRDLRMHDEPVPEPGAGEVQIQVKSVGICASDLHYYRDGRIGNAVVTSPLVLGHEASGIVSKLGEGVTGLSVGDPVAIEPANPCMQCEQCKAGYFNLCPDIPFFGTPPTDGCFRDYITWPARLALKVSNKMSHPEIAMLEPLAVGIYAAELGAPKADDICLILGAGAIGLSVLESLKAMGVKDIIVSEPIEARRSLAIRLGAANAIDPSAQNAEEEAKRLTNGRGAAIVFECTGDENAVREASRMAAIRGKVVVVGIPDGDDYPFDASASRRKQLSAIFVRRSNNTAERAIEWVSDGLVDVASFVTHRFPLEKAAEAMELAIAKTDGVVRAVIDVN